METTPEQCGPRNAYLSDCASRTVIDVIANKWTCLLLGALRDGPVRFGGLKRTIEGVSQKSLTQCLRNLERDGIIERNHYPTIPPRVEYSLTPLGRSVLEFTDGIRRWSEEHADQILAARQAFAEQQAAELVPVP